MIIFGMLLPKNHTMVCTNKNKYFQVLNITLIQLGVGRVGGFSHDAGGSFSVSGCIYFLCAGE